MKKIKYILLTLGLLSSFAFSAIPANTNAQVDVFKDACSGAAATTAICKDREKDKAPKFVKDLVNMLLYVLGAVSIVVIIFAGIFYTTSIGDPALVTKAKNTLLYAVVGLIVAISAYAIVNFVLDWFKI